MNHLHKTAELQVQRAAEECALVIPAAINPEQALPILNNIIQTAKFPIHWAAIKMQVEVSRRVCVTWRKASGWGLRG